MNEELANISMQIIIHSGDARTLIFKALKALAENNFELASKELVSAKKELTEAHKIHTNVIQSEARGEESEYSILFSHAQDTLMTINTELDLSKSLLQVFKSLDERIRKLEEG